MNFVGKLIGGFFGFLLGGTWGLFLGAAIGHLFDKGLSKQWTSSRGSSEQNQEAQNAFFDATFRVMGHIAKIDGRVSEAEIQGARATMSRLGLNEALRQKAMHLFNEGKKPNFDLYSSLENLRSVCQRSPILLKMFVEIQVQNAMADGGLTPEKQRIIQQICQMLGFAMPHFSFFENLFNFEKSRYQYQQQESYSSNNAPRQPSGLELQGAYNLLGVNASSNPAEIKKAYRRLMSQHHPDKLVAKGLPEQMIKLATEKTQNIQLAYEKICLARGI